MSKKKHIHKQPAQSLGQQIEMLGTVGLHIDDMLDASQKHYQALEPARSKPYILDCTMEGI